jgi:protein SCO1
MTARTSQILLILSAFVTGLVVFAGVFLYATGNFGGSGPASSAIGGPFRLIDQNGNPITEADIKGRPFLVFFGYTHCPDVCPTTLVEMGNHLAALGPDADRLKVVFVTVDAARDTPEHLRTYLASFDARIIGLTGSEGQIAEAAQGWNAHYNKFTESDGSITIVHSAHVYLMDADNRLAATLNFQEAEAEQLAKLRALLAGKPAN